MLGIISLLKLGSSRVMYLRTRSETLSNTRGLVCIYGWLNVILNKVACLEFGQNSQYSIT